MDECENMGRARNEEIMTNAQTMCSISGVDGLPSTIPKRKYKMTKRVRKDKRPRRIGSSRAEKVSLANVQQDLQSIICSKGCLKKLDAGAILMK